MSERRQPPEALVERIRAICSPLVRVAETAAWTGTSWQVRSTTFAHVVQIEGGLPPVYAKAFGTLGPATVVTFQSTEAYALVTSNPAFCTTPWRKGLVGLTLSDTTDWAELAELLVESHRLCSGRP